MAEEQHQELVDLLAIVSCTKGRYETTGRRPRAASLHVCVPSPLMWAFA